jgi:prefoldin alpha subunit
MEKNEQELMFQLSMYEQQMQQFQQQLQSIEQGIIEMSSLNIGLDELIGSEGKEILSSIGRGIFVKTKLLSEELIVDIGEKTFVKKNIPETKQLIQKQIVKLENLKKELNNNLEKLNAEIMNFVNNSAETKK